MPFQIFDCPECGRPVIPTAGSNYFRVTAGDEAEVARHHDCDSAPEPVELPGPAAAVGETMRDPANEVCIVTRVENGTAWGVRQSDLAEWTSTS